jgi:hypothetical protein
MHSSTIAEIGTPSKQELLLACLWGVTLSVSVRYFVHLTTVVQFSAVYVLLRLNKYSELSGVTLLGASIIIGTVTREP